MSLPTLANPAKRREWALPILAPAAGVPLIRKTQNLEIRLIWLDGFHSCDWDFDPKYRDKFLLKAWEKLIAWKAGEMAITHKGQGYGLPPFRASRRPPERGWHRFAAGRFWWKGPLEALVFGRHVYAGDRREPDFDGTKGPWLIGRVLRSGEDHLNDTGGRIGYRVGSWFTLRETLATKEFVREFHHP